MADDEFVFICLKCGHSQAVSTKTRYCPNDGSLLARTRASSLKGSKAQTAATDEFEPYWESLCEDLSEPRLFFTMARSEPFTAKYTPLATIVVTPLSSNRSRPISKVHFKEVYRRWLQLEKSYNTSYYEAMSVNSSYVLQLLEVYFDRKLSHRRLQQAHLNKSPQAKDEPSAST